MLSSWNRRSPPFGVVTALLITDSIQKADIQQQMNIVAAGGDNTIMGEIQTMHSAPVRGRRLNSLQWNRIKMALGVFKKSQVLPGIMGEIFDT